MEKILALFFIAVTLALFLRLLYWVLQDVFAEKGMPKYPNPPAPPKKKCVGIVQGRRLNR